MGLQSGRGIGCAASRRGPSEAPSYLVCIVHLSINHHPTPKTRPVISYCPNQCQQALMSLRNEDVVLSPHAVAVVGHSRRDANGTAGGREPSTKGQFPLPLAKTKNRPHVSTSPRSTGVAGCSSPRSILLTHRILLFRAPVKTRLPQLSQDSNVQRFENDNRQTSVKSETGFDRQIRPLYIQSDSECRRIGQFRGPHWQV